MVLHWSCLFVFWKITCRSAEAEWRWKIFVIRSRPAAQPFSARRSGGSGSIRAACSSWHVCLSALSSFNRWLWAANAIMPMIIFWRGRPAILELNLSWSFILWISHRDSVCACVCVCDNILSLFIAWIISAERYSLANNRVIPDTVGSCSLFGV